MFRGIQILGLGALPVLMQVDHKSSSSDDVSLQQMEKTRENIQKMRLQVLYRVILCHAVKWLCHGCPNSLRDLLRYAKIMLEKDKSFVSTHDIFFTGFLN